MNQSRRPSARWVIVAFLISAGAACWEIGADAGRVRVASRFLAGQTVSLASAGASDSYVLVASLAVCVALAVAVAAFVEWLRRTRRSGTAMPAVLSVWWALWLLANIVGRLVELSYRSTSSLADIRNLALLDLGDCVALIASLLAMVFVIRRGAAGRRWTATVAVTAAALVVAPLTLAFVVSNGTTKVTRPSATPAPQSAAWASSNAAATTCSDAMFQPGGAISAGASSACADLTLGAALLSADCTKASLPASLSPEIFDNTGQSSELGTVRAAAGGCDLTTSSTSVTAAVLAGDPEGPTNEPGSVVVVADFIPANNPAGLNTVGVRVSSSSELDVAVGSNGGYAVIESTNGATPVALLQGSFSSGQAGAPNLAKAIRVVVYVKGSTAAAYVDGLRLGSGPTSVPNAPGGCGFSLSTNDASKPVVATLLHLEIFATT
jgi:hypothetical protein